MWAVVTRCGSLRTLATGGRSGHATAGGDRRTAKPSSESGAATAPPLAEGSTHQTLTVDTIG
jgi:hypothetical protein